MIDFIDRHWIKLLLVICAAVIASLFVSCEPSKHLKVPVEFCQSSYTGRTRTEQQVYYTCAAYDDKMNCTVQVPNFYDVQRNEVRTVCDFVEWR